MESAGGRREREWQLASAWMHEVRCSCPFVAGQECGDGIEGKARPCAFLGDSLPVPRRGSCLQAAASLSLPLSLATRVGSVRSLASSLTLVEQSRARDSWPRVIPPKRFVDLGVVLPLSLALQRRRDCDPLTLPMTHRDWPVPTRVAHVHVSGVEMRH